MSTVIQIKRSANTTAPSDLYLGELAYTYGTGTQGNNGDRLFIGEGGVGGDGYANNVTVIGGQYFVDKLDHVDGTLTASSALTVDSNLAIDTLNIGNSTTVGGSLKLNEGTNNGSNYIALKAPNAVTSTTTFVLPDGDGSNGQFLQTDGSGNLSFGTVTQTLSIAADTGSNDSVSTGETITFSGDTGITTSVTDNEISIDLDDTAVTPGSYGSATSIPTFTVDQQGRLTAAGSASISTTLTIVDESSTAATISLATDTLKITGGSGITTAASGDTISINLDANVVTEDSTDTLTNKTIDSANNTLTLDLSEGTLTGTTAEFNTALSDGSFATLAGTETLTNKTIDTANNTITVSEADISDLQSYILADSTDTLTNKTINSASNTITITESNISDLGAYITASSTDTLTNKTINASQLVDGSVSNAKLTNSSVTIGSDSVSLGATQTDLNGITSLDVDNITVDGNTITSTDSNGDLVLDANGTGSIDVNSNKIINVATPTADTDAANKSYVDGVVNGLDVKESVSVATTANLSATYDNGAGTLTAGSNGALSIDGVTPSQGDRVLVKDQTTQTQNGIYTVTTVGDGSTAFVLTRAPDADTAAELTGGTFFFVEAGSNNADNGYVATHNGVPTFGTTNITFSQFSGAGQISAGAALSKTGNQLDVEVDDSSIEVSSDALQVKALGITNAMLAGSIANAKLTNSSISIGGVTFNLGDTDATPALDLSDATNYPTSSLSGTIANNQLANSTVSFSDDSSTSVSVGLGSTLAINGGEGVDATISGSTLTIAGELATTSNIGVASFNSANFSVSSGDVTVTAIDGGTF